MLHFARRLPADAGAGTPVLLLLHGRGSDERDLLSLAPHLPPRFALVAARAPFAAAPWGYGPGWAWYRFTGGRAPEPESFLSSLDALGELIGGLPQALGFAPGELVLGGFSQGGTTAVGYALSAREAAARPPVARVAVLSGFLPESPAVHLHAAAGLPVFWGHGWHDGSIPFAWGEEGRAALRAAGARVTARDYPMGHGISPAELRDLATWLGQDPGGEE